jgi:hypothetical protein
MWITDKKQPYLFGIMLKPQHNVIADNVLQLYLVAEFENENFK